jgi:hypothetical protein
MARRFTSTEEKELRPLLESGAPIPIAEVRRILGLGEMPHAHLLAEDTWLLGGRLVRWLSGEMQDGKDDGDYDMYCGSVAAFERTARRMLESGYRQCRWRAPANLWQGLRGLAGGHDGHARCFSEEARTVPVQELLRQRRFADGSEMYVLQFHSPEGHVLQLVHLPSLFREGMTVQNQMAFTDLSICQFTLDDRYLHAGPHSWADLLQRRVRVVEMARPHRTAMRLIKYGVRGFRPYASTVGTVYGAWFAEALGRRRHASR